MNDLQIDSWVKEGILPSISEIDESQVTKIDGNILKVISSNLLNAKRCCPSIAFDRGFKFLSSTIL